jgi:RNA polymerase sigma factor (sigma-70 family)
MRSPSIAHPVDPSPGPPLLAAVVDAWFVEAVLPLEPALMRFLRHHWREPEDVADLRQDVYVRMYESALRDGLPQNTAAVVYTCARHLIIDRARRAQVVSIETVADLEALDLAGDEIGPERRAGAREELRLLQAALDGLPPRCRAVVTLRKIDGLSQREVAQHLGIAEGTVEKQITLGIRALAESLYAHGVEITMAWGRRLRDRENDA